MDNWLSKLKQVLFHRPSTFPYHNDTACERPLASERPLSVISNTSSLYDHFLLTKARQSSTICDRSIVAFLSDDSLDSLNLFKTLCNLLKKQSSCNNTYFLPVNRLFTQITFPAPPLHVNASGLFLGLFYQIFHHPLSILVFGDKNSRDCSPCSQFVC